MFGITIFEAGWNEMCGSIEFQVRETRMNYRIMFNTTDGIRMQYKEMAETTWSKDRRVEHEEIVRILPRRIGWTYDSFVAAWAGWSEGFQQGQQRKS